MPIDWAHDERIDAIRAATERLTAEGGPYAVTEEEVLGERMPVFAERQRSLRQVLVDGAAHGDRDCYVFSDGTRLTFAELPGRVAAVAAGLAERHGVGPGDRVAICAANGPEWLLTFWAAASLGAVVTAMNGWWTGPEMQNGIELSEPKVLLMDAKRRARLEGDPGVPLVRFEDDFPSLAVEGAALPDTPIGEDDPVMLVFTSGTTGRPKAAVLSHRAVISYLMCQALIAVRGAVMAGRTGSGGPPPTRLAPFPMFHVSGLSMAVSSVMGGQTSVWPLGRFDAEAVIELTRREDVALWGGGTTHIARLLDSPSLSSLPQGQILGVSVAGSATPPELIRRTEERFPHLTGTMSTGYGSTETGLVAWAPNWMLAEAPDCVGLAMPTVEIRIRDDDGQPLPDGEVGDIEVRSPQSMTGYWNNDAANADTVLPGRWIRTGDFGRLEHGVLFIATRRRDLIIRGGENIYPFEIENRLDEHPDVLEAAVFGVDDPVYGQAVKAVVVAREGALPDPDDLRTFCAEALAYYKVPTYLEVRRDLLPRTPTGKVMKHVLSGAAENTFLEE